MGAPPQPRLQRSQTPSCLLSKLYPASALRASQARPLLLSFRCLWKSAIANDLDRPSMSFQVLHTVSLYLKTTAYIMYEVSYNSQTSYVSNYFY